MRPESEFTIIRKDLFFDKYNKPIYLVPFGDIHYGADNHHVEKFNEFCEWGKGKKDSYYIGMGDYTDLMSWSERGQIELGKAHESTETWLESKYKEMLDEFCNKIMFMKGKLVGLVEGNHYIKFSSGITSTQYIADKLGCKYLGGSAFIQLLIQKKGDPEHKMKMNVWCHHGYGGGRTIGASVNKLEKMLRIADFDIGLLAHDHRKHISMVSKLALTDSRKELNLISKKVLLARTGSFLKGYNPNKASYVAQQMLSPTDLGTVKIEMTPKRKEVNGVDTRYIDVHASI